MQWVPYLAQGFTAQQIVDFIGRAYPSIGDAASEAQQAGKSAKEVFDWLRKFKEPELKKLNESYAHRSKENYLLRSNEATEKAGMDLSKIGMAGLALGAGGLLSRGIPALARSGVGQKIGDAIMGKKEPSLQNLPQPSSGTIAPAQAEEKSVSPSDDIVRQLKLGPLIDNLRKAGNNSQQIRAGLEVGMDPTTKKAYDVLVKSGKAPKLETVVEEYLKSSPVPSSQEEYVGPAPDEKPIQQPTPPVEPKEEPSAKEEKFEEEEPERREEELKPLTDVKKGQEVMTPSGIVGQIAAENGKTALIDDGKKFVKVPVDQLHEVSDNYKDIKFDLSQVKEEDRSAALAYVLPDHNNKALFVRYFEGLKPRMYKYFRKDLQPISQDTLERIGKGLGIPVTSGISFGGAWNQEIGDSRGGANYQDMVREAEEYVEGSEGDPNVPLWYVKLDPIFTHGYLEMAENGIREAEKIWNRIHRPKKPKKPPAPPRPRPPVQANKRPSKKRPKPT